MALALAFAPEVAMAQMSPSSPGFGAPPISMQTAPMVGRGVRMVPPTTMPPMRMPNAEPTMAPTGPARWSQVPGGASAYRRPSYGYQLPSYWIAPTYFIGNYSAYGLPAPSEGFGWSRYYDDAVLTDSYGRVYDWREGGNWASDRGEDYGDSYGYRDEARDVRDSRDYRGSRRVSRNAGAAIGGVVGGVAGNVIAGSGNRLAGTLIGAGVGAATGAVIGTDVDRRRERREGRGGYRFEGDARRGPQGQYSYDGRWTGSWDGGPTRTYDGRFDGNVRTHWATGGGGYAQSYASSGYGYGGGETVTTTTVVSGGAPIVTRSVSYVTDYVRVAQRRHVRTYKPRAKPRCTVVCCACAK